MSQKEQSCMSSSQGERNCLFFKLRATPSDLVWNSLGAPCCDTAHGIELLIPDYKVYRLLVSVQRWVQFSPWMARNLGGHIGDDHITLLGHWGTWGTHVGHLGHSCGALGALMWGTWGTHVGHLGHSCDVLGALWTLLLGTWDTLVGHKVHWYEAQIGPFWHLQHISAAHGTLWKSTWGTFLEHLVS